MLVRTGLVVRQGMERHYGAVGHHQGAVSDIEFQDIFKKPRANALWVYPSL